MKRVFLFLISFAFTIFSDVNIEVQFESGFFDIKNYVKNSGFETKSIWREYGSKIVDGKWVSGEIIGEYTNEDKFEGNFSYKIKGKRGINGGISQSITFEEPVEGYLYLSYRIKIKGITNEGAKPGASIQATFKDNESKYLPGLSIDKGNFDWEEIKWTYEIPKPIKSLTLYLTYYDQEGECYYDDVVLSVIKKKKIKYKVEGEGIKSIKLYSEEGLIKDTGDLKGIGKYEGEEEILPVFDYYIEVEDVKGKKYVKTLKERKTEEKKGELYIGYIRQEKILKGGEKEYTFKIKKEEGKKYILYLKARLNSEKFGGHTNALEINLNGKPITFDKLVERKRNFTTADGRTHDVGANVFRVYYCPLFAIPPEDNPYFPVDIPNNDPYTYKFEITDLLREEENKIIIRHRGQVENPLVIRDLKIIEK